MTYIEKLREVIHHLHGVVAVHVESVPIKEVYQGKTIWEGVVEVFDITGQRDRAVNEYTQAQRTRDNTQGAQDEVAKFLRQPYAEKTTKDAV